MVVTVISIICFLLSGGGIAAGVYMFVWDGSGSSLSDNARMGIGFGCFGVALITAGLAIGILAKFCYLRWKENH